MVVNAVREEGMVVIRTPQAKENRCAEGTGEVKKKQASLIKRNNIMRHCTVFHYLFKVKSIKGNLYLRYCIYYGTCIKSSKYIHVLEKK